MTDPPLDVVAEDLGAWHALHVHGEIDADTAPVLRQACADAVREGHASLIIDLSDVPFIDSSGLSALLSAKRRVAAAGGRLRLVTEVATTLRLLQITGLDEAFDVRPDLESAKTEAVAEPS
jgi:anti-anti-sigma factor